MASTPVVTVTTSPESPFCLGAPAAPAGRTLHVLHLINGEHFAGAERVQDLLALRLPEYGVEVAFACMKPGQFAAVRQSRDARLWEVPMRGRIDLRPVARLAGLVRSAKFDLLHTHTARGALIGRLVSLWTGVPMIHHMHSPAAADTTHRLRNWVNVASERLSLRGVRAVIAVSESLGRYARGMGLPTSKVFVVHNGVPVQGPLAPRPTPTAWTLGMTALFRPRKGIEVLLEALALLRREGRDVRLRAVGGFETPGYETEVRDLARRLELDGAIDWRGFQKDIRAELAAIDLFVLPSLFGEGLPMVVLEAMAAGVPIVSTRVEGIPEAVRDGLDGLIAAPNDPADLAAAIRRFLLGEVDWQACRTSAHARQAGHFSDRSMAAHVAEVYRRVLGPDDDRRGARCPPAVVGS